MSKEETTPQPSTEKPKEQQAAAPQLPVMNSRHLSIVAVAALSLVVLSGVGVSAYHLGQHSEPHAPDHMGARMHEMSEDRGDMRGEGSKRGHMRGGMIGTVTAIDATSLTIENSHKNTTRTYTITNDTTVTKDDTKMAIGDVKKGATIAVRSSRDTPTTATTIIIDPAIPPHMVEAQAQ